MGFYIDVPKMGAQDKAATLFHEYGAEQTLPIPPSKVPSDKALVCVVKNGLFDAAAFIFDDEEYRGLQPTGWSSSHVAVDGSCLGRQDNQIRGVIEA